MGVNILTIWTVPLFQEQMTKEEIIQCFQCFGMMSLNSWLDMQIDFQKNLILGRRKSCIIIKLKSRETPKAIKQVPI